jgi:transcriptional regulator with XRE-family HTH domain
MATIDGMKADATTESSDLANKIARLVEERGWNQEEFARITRLNRHTVRQILISGDRRLRNATTSACAKALGLSVNDLRTLSLEQLLSRMRAAEAAGNGADPRRRLREESHNPELLAWAEENPERIRQLTPDEVNELLSFQTASGAPSTADIDRLVDRMERRRTLVYRVAALAGSEHLDLLEQFVALLYEKMKSRAGRP